MLVQFRLFWFVWIHLSFLMTLRGFVSSFMFSWALSLSLSIWGRLIRTWWGGTSTPRSSSLYFLSFMFLAPFTLFFTFLGRFFSFMILRSFWNIFSLHFLDNLLHLKWIAHKGLSSPFLLSLNLKHRIFMKERKILTFFISYFLLKNMLELFSCICIGFFISS